MAFGNLTVDFKQLSKIPVRDRVALARSPKASEIFGNMSPSEIAALFPDYYKKFIPQAGGGGSMAAGLTGAGITTGTGTASSTGYTGTSSSTAPTSTSYMDEILSGIPGQGGKVAGTGALKGRQANMKSVYDAYIHAGFSHKQALAFTAEVGRENGYNPVLMYGTHTDLNGHTNAGMISMQKDRRTNLYKYLGERGLLDANGKMIQSQETLNAQAEFQMQEIKDKYPKTAKNFLANPDISMEDAAVVLGDDYIRWARKGNPRIGFSAADAARHAAGRDRNYYEIQKITEDFDTQPTATLPGTQPQTGEAPQGTDVSIENLAGTPASQNTAAVVAQTTTFDPNIFSQLDPRIKEEYIKASDSEKKRIETAITKLGVSGVQKIMEKYPQKTASAITDTTVQESNKKFTEASSASGFYDGLRKNYPEKIDVNSEIWNQVDPVLAAARRQIVDAETGLVGRDALLAADSASKVLRTNNYTPRVASGGDNHSKNHGSGRDANYSIDLAASVVNEQGNLVPVNLGTGMPEKVKNDMATAAYFATMGAEGGHRIGYPDDSSPHSMHIQQDPIRPDAFWGYSEIAKRKGIDSSTKAALTATNEGKRFLQERETIERLSPEEKAAYFDSITGFEAKKAAIVAADISKTIPDSIPQTQPSQVNQNTGSDVAVTNMEGSPAQTTTVEPQPTANTAPTMKLGGDLNFKEPNTVKESMSLIADGKKVADFNKDEAVSIEDGKMSVENAYKKTAKETQQKTDKGMPKSDNQFSMRQTTTDAPKPYGEQSKYGIVPESPSIARQTQMAQFGGYNHFSRRSHSA